MPTHMSAPGGARSDRISRFLGDALIVVASRADLVGVALVVAASVGFPLTSRSAAQQAEGTDADSAAGPAGTRLLDSSRQLDSDADLASDMVDGIDRFLVKMTERAEAARDREWIIDAEDEASYVVAIASRRERLRSILGIADPRPAEVAARPIVPPGDAGVLAESDDFIVHAIRWPAIVDPAPQTGDLVSVWGEGLLLIPKGEIRGDVVAVPDAGQTPEALCGLESGVDPRSRFPLRLAASGCRVVVPHVTSRHREPRGGKATLTDREYIHRAAFVLGRTLPGYEVQKVLAVTDWLHSSARDGRAESEPRPIGAIGYGEGGQLAMFAAALDDRITATGVSGFFGPRSRMWREPLDRNLSGFVREFDAPQLGLMVAPRCLVVEASGGPDVTVPGEGGAPGRIEPIAVADVEATAERLRALLDPLAERFGWEPSFDLVVPKDPAATFGSEAFVATFLDVLFTRADAASLEPAERSSDKDAAADFLRVAVRESEADRRARQQRRRNTQLAEMDRHNQAVWRESEFVRAEYFDDLDRSNLDQFRETIEPYRERFRDDVIGRFDQTLADPSPRARPAWQGDGWIGYEVALDVFPDVFAYGALLLPEGCRPGERRPVVVFQHGLEGRPTQTFLGSHRAYHDHAARLCQQGFIVFAPQNPYLFGDRFRQLQRRAQPLGRSLFSVIVPQHQQIVNWLRTLPFVDGDRIAFYGLSYGGKSAMRIPALVTDYCLSICSADFNEWVLKNASTRDRFSYVWTGEYEIFEWNLGGRFNYAEMASLICPRPFMVERGHFDGVGVDPWVAYEYAKVRHLYAARLGIPDRTEIAWFPGPHEIDGEATTAFLRRHLDWPASAPDPDGPAIHRDEPARSQDAP